VIASLSFGDDGHTADGVRINEAFAQLRAAGADVTGINCHFGPTLAEKLLEELAVRPGDLISVYPNAGRPYFYEGRYIYHPTPAYFAEFAPRLVAQGARLIGGCLRHGAGNDCGHGQGFAQPQADHRQAGGPHRGGNAFPGGAHG